MKEVAACDFPYNKLFVNCLFLWESATGEKDVLCMYCTRYWAQTHAQHKNVTHRIRKCKLIPPMYVVHFPDRPPPYCHVIMYICTYWCYPALPAFNDGKILPAKICGFTQKVLTQKVLPAIPDLCVCVCVCVSWLRDMLPDGNPGYHLRHLRN